MNDGDSVLGDAATPGDDAASQPSCGSTYPRLDLKVDCGAIGDGVADDTAAFQKAAQLLQAAGGGQLVLPVGQYVVGRQTIKPAGAAGPYYRAAEIFSVQGLKCLVITGYGAKVRVAAGLRYGGFDAVTGAPKSSTGSSAEEAQVGRVFSISSSEGVSIAGVELDGNCGALILGGQWGNVDRQAAATGIFVNRCSDVEIVDVHTHHHALDGLAVEYQGGPPPKKMPHKISRTVSEYNGRQGLSWIGGWGLECTDCKFNHTGRTINHGGGQNDGAPLVSQPAAGFDIEPNGGTTEMSRDGLFTNCEFVDNAGAGMVASNGDGGYTTFVGCTFWGTTNVSVWARQPGLRFTTCFFHGTAMHVNDGSSDANSTPNPSLATFFEGCTFEDKPWTDGAVYRNNALYTVATGGASGNGGAGATWKNCTFVAHAVRGVYIDDPSTTEIFDGCSFTHGHIGLSDGTYQSMFQGSQLTSCHFMESAALSAGAKNYSIDVKSVVVAAPPAGGSPTKVDGPKMKWKNPTNGTTGVIAPGPY